jgi:uncharacterized protein YdbL (DUF1318 family)
MNLRIVALCALTAAIVAVLGLSSASAGEMSEDQITAQLAVLQPKLDGLKGRSKVGETYAGYVEAVNPGAMSPDDNRTVGDVNALRRALYIVLARKHNITPEQVGQIAGRNNYNRARPGEFFKQSDGKWIRKQ